MKNRLFLSLVTLGVVVLFSSCDKVPQVEIDAANVQISEVKAAQADLYQPAMYAAIQDSMKVVNELVEVQKSKWFKKFDAVRVKLANINAYAVVVKDSTESRKAAVKAEAEATLTAVKALIEEDKALVAKAPKGKEGKEALEAINSELTVIEGSTNEVASLLEGGNYLAALDKVKAANEKATSIKAELEEAIAKKSGKKAKK
jgi:outer membrane PBP1 activator LpoA protein